MGQGSSSTGGAQKNRYRRESGDEIGFFSQLHSDAADHPKGSNAEASRLHFLDAGFLGFTASTPIKGCLSVFLFCDCYDSGFSRT